MAYRMRRNGSEVALKLGSLVATLRALYQLHQAHHWQSSGPNYFADHQLYERLYTPIPEEIDAVAERTVGLGDAMAVSSALQARLTDATLQAWASAKPGGSAGQARAALSLMAEMTLLDEIDGILRLQGVSNGVQNLLQGIADKHESNVYLLQQRLGE